MKKEQYERAELEIIQFQTEDVITTSDPMKKFYLSGWNDFSKNKKRACNVGTPPPR